jgi:colanic acid/amylovoran biosynthesis protein
MTRILITNCHNTYNLGCEYNRGGAAVLISTIKMLRRCIPHAEFTTFVQLSDDFSKECGLKVIRNKTFSSKPFSLRTMLKSSSNLVRCILWAVSHKRFSLPAKALISNRELREYADADVILDVSMDHYSDDFGCVSIIEHSKDILLGVLLKKPVIIWAQSLGPFRSKLTSWLVRLALNRVALITVRDEISLAHLRELGVDGPPTYVTADPAFLLEPAGEERARDILAKEEVDASETPIVGLTLSCTTLMAEAKGSAYLQYMESAYRIIRLILPETLFGFAARQASHFKRLDMSSFLKVEVICEIMDYLVEKLDATIVLIPHDTDPFFDDRIIARDVLQRAKQPKRVRLIMGDYSAPELKAVIGKCDLFIGGKMHANIAATSMHVPTVGMQYGHKFYGIMRLLGQEQYVCNKFTVEELKSKVDRAWADRERIRGELAAKTDILKKYAFYNAKLVEDLLHSNRVSSVFS